MKAIGMFVFFVGVLMFIGGMSGCAMRPQDNQVAYGCLGLVGFFIAGWGLDTMRGQTASILVEDEECNCCDNCDRDCECECHD